MSDVMDACNPLGGLRKDWKFKVSLLRKTLLQQKEVERQ